MKTPKLFEGLASELDRQSPVKIDKWIDIDSEECRNLDPDISLTKKWLNMMIDSGVMFVDARGYLWGNFDGKMCPYHFNIGKTLYGYRMSKAALN